MLKRGKAGWRQLVDGLGSEETLPPLMNTIFSGENVNKLLGVPTYYANVKMKLEQKK